MNRIAIAAVLATLSALPASAGDVRPRAPFLATLSNTAPLTFGMTPDQASAVLGAPLQYVRGRPGHAMFIVPRPSPGLFNREARLFLQFRHNRLTGWKGDWGRNWRWD